MNQHLETTKSTNQTAGSSGLNIRKIVVPVDLSPGSEQIVGNGVELAKRFGASVTLLYVFPPEPVREWTHPQFHENVEQKHRLTALKLTKLMGQVRQAGVRCDYDFLAGDPAEQVTLAAENLKADLIITSIHHAGSFVRGSGLDQVPRILDRANCPVLVFPEESD
jgi:nucleotide-binding universal stress UspA family protein